MTDEVEHRSGARDSFRSLSSKADNRLLPRQHKATCPNKTDGRTGCGSGWYHRKSWLAGRQRPMKSLRRLLYLGWRPTSEMEMIHSLEARTTEVVRNEPGKNVLRVRQDDLSRLKR